MTNQTIYVLYNADASVMGKLRYGYRKTACPADGEPECAACDITHGGLSLKETPSWLEVKKEIEDSSDTKVVQWHRDELSPQVKLYIEEHKIAYPVALLERDRQLQVVMNPTELGICKGDAQAFITGLRAKGIINPSSQPGIKL